MLETLINPGLPILVGVLMVGIVIGLDNLEAE